MINIANPGDAGLTGFILEIILAAGVGGGVSW
jgi:hypothetical protein